MRIEGIRTDWAIRPVAAAHTVEAVDRCRRPRTSYDCHEAEHCYWPFVRVDSLDGCWRDLDGDGIPDFADPDIDGDGIPNSLDLAPSERAAGQRHRRTPPMRTPTSPLSRFAAAYCDERLTLGEQVDLLV